jgi:olefin beta-lactone synthetase
LLEALVRIVRPSAEVYTPYGATESLPISLPTARALLDGPSLRTAEGKGTCVGVPLSRAAVRIIAISDQSISRIEDAPELPAGEIGEIIVRSKTTTTAYFRRPEDDARSKIRDDGVIWHRMGDVGYLDAQGRLWFCGRKSQRVETPGGPMYTEPCGGVVDRHTSVRRSALVGVGPRPRQAPVIVVEVKAGVTPDERLRAELLALIKSTPVTQAIETVLFHPELPVDPRHNAKIIREALATWASTKLGFNDKDLESGSPVSSDRSPSA